MIAIAFYIVFSSLAAWCAHDDVTYHWNNRKTPTTIKGNV